MLQHDAAGQSSPALVLVAPLPRRPIALVARRNGHHSNSRSRSSRAVSSSSAVPVPYQSPLPSSPDSTNTSNAITTASAQQHSSARLVSHPYTRTKTPSNANHLLAPVSPASSAANPWSSGLSTILPASPPSRTRSRIASADGASSRAASSCPDIATHERPARPAVSSNVVLVHPSAEAGSRNPTLSDTTTPDEPMLASPDIASDHISPVPSMDVELTPTKNRVLAAKRSALVTSEPQLGPRFTHPGAAVAAQSETCGLTLSPTSPTTQRFNAMASASAQLHLSASPPAVPPSAERACIVLNADAEIGSASMTPSPCLSESLSRSPTASPSPCPSPPLGARTDAQPLRGGNPARADTRRDARHKMDLRLPPLPLSPIPRKMTRNPFERYLLAHSPPDINARADHSGSAALHARLVRAITQNVDATPPVLVAIEARLAGSGASDVDEEMASVENASSARPRSSAGPNTI